MNYFETTFLALNTIINEDSNILALFSFGSFVTNEMSWNNYKEIRVFDNGDFVLSKFNLLNIKPDIDLVCVSENPEKTREVIEKNLKEINNHFVTINVISKGVFEEELSSQEPNAVKRIVSFRELLIIKGQSYLDHIKNENKRYVTDLDKAFQEEFDFRKNYLRLFAKNNIKTLILNKSEYEHLFPNMLQFIEGKIKAGFPKDRLKLVYPGPMNLKAEIDIAKVELKNII